MAYKRKYGRIPGHTPEPEMAKNRGVKIATLQKERSQGRGPPYIVISRQVHYNDAGYLKWLEAQLHVPVRSGLEARLPRTASKSQVEPA